jgi:hypothetical protein
MQHEREPQTYVYNTPYPKFNGTLTGARAGHRDGPLRFPVLAEDAPVESVATACDNRIPPTRVHRRFDKTPSGAIGTNRRSEQEYGDFTRVLAPDGQRNQGWPRCSTGTSSRT